ncbi:hypothetical protein BDA96_07G238700 [Sorghum bicolor]|uniref:Uncharacterized protein n=1 Tax=Sorghum bicolor TaxID=4558 RepID=A0A921QQ04_SORBI|nr:hypothetical protein BDA96_07G238700 [Sorghum bicolor]
MAARWWLRAPTPRIRIRTPTIKTALLQLLVPPCRIFSFFPSTTSATSSVCHDGAMRGPRQWPATIDEGSRPLVGEGDEAEEE